MNVFEIRSEFWCFIISRIPTPSQLPWPCEKKSEAQDDKVKDAPAGIRSKFEAKLSKFSLKIHPNISRNHQMHRWKLKEKKTWLSKNGHQNVAPESLQAAEMAGWKKMRSLKLWGWLSANVIFTRGERWTWNLFEITKWYQIMFFVSRSQSSTRHGRSN